MKKISLFLAFAIAATFAQAQTKQIVKNNQTVNLDMTMNGATTVMTPKEKGATIVVNLPDNSGSTGYRWTVGLSNTKVLSSNGEKLTDPAQPMPGAPGVRTYTFKVTGNSGTCKITGTRTSPDGRVSTADFVHTVRVGAVRGKRKK